MAFVKTATITTPTGTTNIAVLESTVERETEVTNQTASGDSTAQFETSALSVYKGSISGSYKEGNLGIETLTGTLTLAYDNGTSISGTAKIPSFQTRHSQTRRNPCDVAFSFIYSGTVTITNPA